MRDSREPSTVAVAPAASEELDRSDDLCDDDTVLDDVLVEDVSIDGMCGVY